MVAPTFHFGKKGRETVCAVPAISHAAGRWRRFSELFPRFLFTPYTVVVAVGYSPPLFVTNFLGTPQLNLQALSLS